MLVPNPWSAGCRGGRERRPGPASPCGPPPRAHGGRPAVRRRSRPPQSAAPPGCQEEEEGEQRPRRAGCRGRARRRPPARGEQLLWLPPCRAGGAVASDPATPGSTGRRAGRPGGPPRRAVPRSPDRHPGPVVPPVGATPAFRAPRRLAAGRGAGRGLCCRRWVGAREATVANGSFGGRAPTPRLPPGTGGWRSSWTVRVAGVCAGHVADGVGHELAELDRAGASSRLWPS